MYNTEVCMDSAQRDLSTIILNSDLIVYQIYILSLMHTCNLYTQAHV